MHIGKAWGYFGSIITYFMAIPLALRKYPADLVVEDFAAPISSSLTPLWTHKKTLAMVQWLNAREKSKEYHLPFWIVENAGLRLHRNFIAVSRDLAETIRIRNPRANVEVIGNGVDSTAFSQPLEQNRKDIVFLGRLEREQKGIDLLLNAYAAIVNQTSANLIIIGDGPDKKWVLEQISELGLANRISLVGRQEGDQKFASLARALVVAMPSRFETFGMVAIESLAVGTPVVAFHIACLQEVIPVGMGTLIPAFDVKAYAEALLQYTTSGENTLDNQKQKRSFARTFDWDLIAAKQQKLYELFSAPNAAGIG